MTLVVAGLDLETTGLSQEDGHRIIEIGLSVYTTEDGKVFSKLGKTWLQRINPMRTIDKKAQNVHGIAIEDLRGEPEWERVAVKVQKILSRVDLLVCHNVMFDAPFIGLELARAGYDVPNFDTFCTMENGRGATAMGSVPNLGALCWAMGVNYDSENAHAADYDIDVTMEAFIVGVNKGFFKVPLLQKKFYRSAA